MSLFKTSSTPTLWSVLPGWNLEKNGEAGKLLSMDWWALFFILLLVYQHVSVIEFLNLQSVDACFAQRNAFFQVENTPLWQNWINSIVNWSVCCFERNSIPVFPGNAGISQCERCTWSLVVCYHFSGWNQFYVVEIELKQAWKWKLLYWLAWVEQWIFILIHCMFQGFPSAYNAFPVKNWIKMNL